MNAPVPRDELLEMLTDLRYRPRDFVYWAFPWGERGTDLENFSRLERWQDHFFSYLQERMQDCRMGIYNPIRIHAQSGHGIGKSAVLAKFNLWAQSTAEDTKGIITAGTETQLKTKTWVEMTKWHRLFIANSLFALTATALFPREKGFTKEWRLDIIPWSENNPAAFQGLHNLGKRVTACFDESSGIPKIIHESAAAIDTDINTEVIRVQFGNPTEPSGYFYDTSSHGKLASQWKHFKVDSREVAFTNKDVIAEEIKIHGIDSDYVKVRRLGEFPSSSGEAYIGAALVEKAMAKPIPPGAVGALIMGLDIGRTNDPCVAAFRRGLDAKSIPQREFRTTPDGDLPETLQVFRWVIECIALNDPDAICIDMGHIGAAVYDLLLAKQWARPIIYPVFFGGKPNSWDEQDSKTNCVNMRAKMYARAKVWLHRGSLEDDKQLKEELIAAKYKFHKETELLIEDKEQIKNRLEGKSTDHSDAFLLTHAEQVDIVPEPEYGTMRNAITEQGRQSRRQHVPYNPYSEENIYGHLH